MLKEICVIDTVRANLLRAAMEKLNLSARAYDRILKVSRTIADLEGATDIKPEHLPRPYNTGVWTVKDGQDRFSMKKRWVFFGL